MKLIRALCALLLVAGAASAGQRTFIRNYDVTSTSFIYCATTDFTTGQGRLSTSGSSTSVTAASAVLLQLVAGDEIFVSRPSFPGSPTLTVDRRVVQTTPTSNTALTLTAAADWTGGFTWRFRKPTCGTGAENGWLSVANGYKVTIKWQATTINATSVGYTVECRDNYDSDGAAVTVWPDPANSASTDQCKSGTITTAGATSRCSLVVQGGWDQCRVGFKVNTDTGVQDVSAFLNVTPLLVGAN